MTHKERVLTALRREEPDRVPIHVTYTPEAEKSMAKEVGLTAEKLETYKGAGSDVGLALGHDLLLTWQGIATSFYAQESQTYTCEWGITWRWVENPSGRYTEMVRHPLAGARDLSGYQMPDPHEEARYEDARRLIQAKGDEYAIVGAIACTIFEAAWYLRGLERLLEDLVVNKDFAHELLDMTMGYNRVAGEKLIELGVDIIWMGDDFGTQAGLMMSPELWREFFKPRYAALIAAFKAANPEVIIAYHSCGNIEPLIPEYIEIGLEVLNPIQPLAMDPGRLKRLYGDRLSFWGTVDIQWALPFGTPEEVDHEVRQRIRAAGEGGGLILSPAHNVQADTSVENILAFYRAAERYGPYPLRA